MSPTMVQSIMLTFLMHVFLTSNGVLCREPEGGVTGLGQVLTLPWRDELCCDLSTVHLNVERNAAGRTNGSDSEYGLQRCTYRSLTLTTNPEMPSDGTCWNITCGVDEYWESLSCDLRAPASLNTSLAALSFQRLLLQKEDTQADNGTAASDNPVICDRGQTLSCSLALGGNLSFVAMVIVSVANTPAPPVLLRFPARPALPSPPTNVSHVQTMDAELILHWDPPSHSTAGPLMYEVRYSSNSTHPVWQFLSTEEPSLYLDLDARVTYIIQVRCSSAGEPRLWSRWSDPHHIYLHTVSYIPEKVVARPGENVTVSCVFNDRSINASAAAWKLNFQQELHSSLYFSINPQVSQITVRPSGRWMYGLLQCTPNWHVPYSQIYVQGASIDITCETNGDIDTMTCSWKTPGKPWSWSKLGFLSRWADLPCEVMEERERAGEVVGVLSEVACHSGRLGQELRTCSIHPLRMNCYKLWLELPSRFGPIRSKAIYVSPPDHVKPHAPTNVKAVSRSGGILSVTWEPPPLPTEGLQCQFRYHWPSTVRAQSAWKVQSATRVPWSEAAVPGMCRVYVVQVRCMHTNGTGYWSDWSESVYSSPKNSRAPERGPDFWRILRDDPYTGQTNVTLLFERLPAIGRSYCVDGFVVQHRASSGAVTRERMEVGTTYSFQWNQEIHSISVEAYNSLGSSANNINMTLDAQPKRRCVQSFHVTIINTTCASLSWSLMENSTVPLSMVVQWSATRQQVADRHKGQASDSWARLPYMHSAIYLQGDFFGSEEYGFTVYPVFADGEGEPVHTIATRGDPAAFMMLMIITFLSIVLIVTLILSQNQMKKLVWKDVPNPNKCSWAKGLDFKKTETFDQLFKHPQGLAAWPLLVPPDEISKAVIVEKGEATSGQTAPAYRSPNPSQSLAVRVQLLEEEELLDQDPSSAPPVATSSPEPDDLQVVDPPDRRPDANNSSAQSSVTYSTVLLSDPKQERPTLHLHYKDGSGNCSSDEGNFSANNSDTSGSFPGGLWELDCYRVGEAGGPRRSCSYNSMEKFSETSEQEDEEARERTDLYYLGMDYPAEDEESEEEEEEEEETKAELLNREDRSGESLLGQEELSECSELLAASPLGFHALYRPQFRTVACTQPLG